MSNRRYRINFIHTTTLLMFRGVERWILDVSKYLSRIVSISIITFSAGYENIDIKSIKERLHQINTILKSYNITWMETPSISYENIKAPTPIKRFLKYHAIRIPLVYNVLKPAKGSITYVITGDAISALFFTVLYTMLGSKRIILGLHSRPNYKEFLITRPFFLLLNNLVPISIHAVNIADAIILRDILKGIPVFWIPNGVDCMKFHPQTQKPRDRFQVLFVGALSYDKGVDIVIEIAKKLKNYSNDIKVVVASVGGPLRHVIEEAAKEGFIDYRGFISDQELQRLYAESHVVLLPSRDEAFNLVQLEAQVSGTPVVAPDIAAFRAVIQNGDTGILVKKYDTEEFIKAILKIYELWKTNEAQYRNLCTKSRLNAERFCWERILILLMKLFT